MFEKEFKIELGQLCKELRGNRSLKAVAEGVGVTPMTILNIENSVAISKKTIKKLLEFYELDFNKIEADVNTVKTSIIEITTQILRSENNLLEKSLLLLLEFQSKYFGIFLKYDIEVLMIIVPHIVANTIYSPYECRNIKMFMEDITVDILRDYTMLSIKLQDTSATSEDTRQNILEIVELLENDNINFEVKGNMCLFVSRIYFNQNDKLNTIYYANKSIEIFKELNSGTRLLSSKNVLSGILVLCNDFTSAEIILREIIDDSRTLGLNEFTRIANSNLMWMYYYRKQYERVIDFVNGLSPDHTMSESDKFIYLWSLFMSDKVEFARNELKKYAYDSSDGKKIAILCSIIEHGFSIEIETELLNYIKNDFKHDRSEKYECIGILIEYYKRLKDYENVAKFMGYQQTIFDS